MQPGTVQDTMPGMFQVRWDQLLMVVDEAGCGVMLGWADPPRSFSMPTETKYNSPPKLIKRPT